MQDYHAGRTRQTNTSHPVTQSMKTPSGRFRHLFRAGSIILFCLLALPEDAQAKGPKGDPHGRRHSSSQKKSQHKDNDRNDHDRQAYSSRPRSTFILSLGTGYAGRGYYYGPPNSPYYYERSDVRYYATRDAAPRAYYRQSTDASVQRALAQRGYYHGSIDGRIGSQSRRAIYRYQRDRGLRATGTINSSLLRSLGL
jgi:hypothetical protein